jgi:hypothetical protein
MVPKPQYPIALVAQPVVSNLVFPGLEMLPAIHLDDQLAPEAGKVHDVRAYRGLPAEMKSEIAPRRWRQRWRSASVMARRRVRAVDIGSIEKES